MKKHVAAFTAALLCLGCTLPFNLGSLLPGAQEGLGEVPVETTVVPLAVQRSFEKYDELLTLVEENQVSILEISGSETNLGFTGPVMNLLIRNNANESIEVEIPCGLIFSPASEDTQRMMVVQALLVNIPAGESIEVQPFVVCIDSNKSGPSPEDSFTVGLLAEGKLLQMAECLCREPLQVSQDSMDLMNVQYAVWAAADETASGEDVSLEELFSQMGDNMSPEQQDLMQQYLDLMQDFDTGTNEWLEKCGIENSP